MKMQVGEDNALPSPIAIPSTATSYLAKLYRLGENEKEWHDCGVVRVRCAFVERLAETALILTSEDDPTSVVMETPISRFEYRRDVATIISWADTLENLHHIMNGDAEATPLTDAENAVFELALSFETPEGCARIWEEICAVLGKVSSDLHIDSHSHEDDGTGLSLDMGHSPDESTSHTPMSAFLPPLSRSTLPRLVAKLKTAGPMFRGRLAAELVVNESHRETVPEDALSISSILNLYDEVEKCTNDGAKRKKDLQHLFELVRCVALLEDDKIFEILLTDECFERVAGCLENDPTVRVPPEHRRFLRDEAKFNQVVPITNPRVQGMIMKRFRLGFLRDVLLPRVLDENSFKRLSTMDIALSSDIAQNLHEDADFVANLFRLLSEPASPHRTKGVAFLSELCTLSQKMQLQHRNSFFRTLNAGDRLMTACEWILGDESAQTRERLDVGEILLLVLKHDASIVRSRIIATETVETLKTTSADKTLTKIEGLANGNGATPHNDEPPQGNGSVVAARGKSLLQLLTERLIRDEDAGAQAQNCQVLEILLDPESIIAQHKEDDPFIGIFYSKYFGSFMNALDCLAPEVRRTFPDPDTPLNAAHLISGLLCFCVRMHGYVIREVIAREPVVEKVLQLLECREKHMVLDAIRFLRTCIGMKEKFYNDYFIQHNLFAPVVRAFTKNGPKNNLINSTVIDLLEFIKTENVAPLVEYIVTNFAQDLRPISGYVSTFDELEKLQVRNASDPLVKSPSTQSLHSNSSMSDPFSASRGRVLASTLLGGIRQNRVSARSNIFGESRPMREDDDEALFDEEVSSSPKENSPPKRSRLEPLSADLGSDFDTTG